MRTSEFDKMAGLPVWTAKGCPEGEAQEVPNQSRFPLQKSKTCLVQVF
jgi:hypothetical protein